MRRWIFLFILVIGLLALVAVVSSTSAEAQNVTKLGKKGGHIYMKSDNNILFHTGGGHIEWVISGEVAKEVRGVVDTDNDWNVNRWEGSNFITALDNEITNMHLVYHGAKVLRVSLLNHQIDSDTSGLMVLVNSSVPIKINFIYDAAPADKGDALDLSDDIFVKAIFRALSNYTNVYEYTGEVELKHYNTFVGFQTFRLPVSTEGQVTHYMLPIVDYYEYSVSFKGQMTPDQEDWGRYETFDIFYSLIAFVILLIMWYVAIRIPKSLAAHYNKKDVGGIRLGLGLFAIADLVLYILAFKYIFLISLAVLILILAIGIGYYVYGRSKIAKDLDIVTIKKLEDEAEKKPKRKRLKKEVEEVPEEEKAIDDFDVEEIFFIYKDGRVITHCSIKGRDSVAEKELVGSMLVAIQGFVGDSFRREGQLDSFEFGSNKVTVMTGNHGHLVIVLTGTEPPFMRDRMAEVIQRIEGMYAGIIEDWDGDQTKFDEINRMMSPLFELKKGVKIRPKAEVVKVKSAIEFYEGFLRLKVGVINERKTSITDASFRLTFDKSSLRMHHIDPAYPMDGTTVEIGVITPGEKKSITFYLDPMTCQVTNIDGAATYRDYKGQYQTAVMKRRPAEIVCPIFFTPKTINVAMLRRLKENLPYKDSRILELPAQAELKKVYDLAKKSVSAHNVKEVKEFVQPSPFVGEAWFYGKTAETNEEMIIKIVVNHETKTVQIWVASNNLATQAGLIAEVAHVLGTRVQEDMSLPSKILPSMDEKLKRRVEETILLLDQYEESAAN
jgi:hypothetical protein